MFIMFIKLYRRKMEWRMVGFSDTVGRLADWRTHCAGRTNNWNNHHSDWVDIMKLMRRQVHGDVIMKTEGNFEFASGSFCNYDRAYFLLLCDAHVCLTSTSNIACPFPNKIKPEIPILCRFFLRSFESWLWICWMKTSLLRYERNGTLMFQ